VLEAVERGGRRPRPALVTASLRRRSALPRHRQFPSALSQAHEPLVSSSPRMLPEDQALEIESLEAIYGPDVVELVPPTAASDDATADLASAVVRVRLPVELSQTTLVRLVQSGEDGVERPASELQLRLAHLPPVLLELLLPPAYPAGSPPQLALVGLDPTAPFCPIPSLRQCLGLLLEQAYDQSECLWVFLEMVREGHFLDRAAGADEVVLRPAPGVDVAALGGALSKYEAGVLGQTFAETTYPCGIWCVVLVSSSCRAFC
jgi:hypothetical protein